MALFRREIFIKLMDGLIYYRLLSNSSHHLTCLSFLGRPWYVKGERVEALWQRMRLEGVKPDVSTWVSRVQALASVGSFKGRIHELLTEAAKDRLELDSVFLR